MNISDGRRLALRRIDLRVATTDQKPSTSRAWICVAFSLTFSPPSSEEFELLPNGGGDEGASEAISIGGGGRGLSVLIMMEPKKKLGELYLSAGSHRILRLRLAT